MKNNFFFIVGLVSWIFFIFGCDQRFEEDEQYKFLNTGSCFRIVRLIILGLLDLNLIFLQLLFLLIKYIINNMNLLNKNF
jgi:hypothetical protein